ncbi:MAG: glyoxalase/bleomycin resistance/dioxygenase family protein [Actinobacteria bacterium]|nr:MAG: glyoxalase/bleomycin resistance/dioxygenase family protein [Actinomycetota bacterium]
MATIQNITFACDEPVRLAEFWEAALGYGRPEFPEEFLREIDAAIERGELDPTAWAMLVPPDGRGPRLLFRRRPKTREAEVERLVGLGATVVETKSQRVAPVEETWTVMKDPEGNGFCVQ